MVVIVYLCSEKNLTLNNEKMKPKKKMTIGIDEYIKANKKLAREEELARNGGRWVAKDRPHKNLKRYDRKRDKKNFDSYLSLTLL
jgi:hypothetical protein